MDFAVGKRLGTSGNTVLQFAQNYNAGKSHFATIEFVKKEKKIII